MNQSKSRPGNGLDRKTKIGMVLTGVLLLAAVVGMIWGVTALTNREAVQGEITVSSGGESIHPLSNVLKEIHGEGSRGYAPLELEEISEDLPVLQYKGDLTMKYSAVTMENFTFSMYREDMTECYTGFSRYEHPQDDGENPSGTYIVKVQFSWGQSEKNQIYTENYFKIQYP